MAEWIAAGGVLGVIGLIFGIYKNLEYKVNRTYQRLDVTKDYQDKTFTRKDICMIIHKQIDAKLPDIASDIKILIRESNGGKKD